MDFRTMNSNDGKFGKIQILGTLVAIGVAIGFGLAIQRLGIVKDDHLNIIAIGIMVVGLAIWVWIDRA